MSSFNCERCGTAIIDTEYGYITSCEHYKSDKKAIDTFKTIYTSMSVSQLQYQDEEFVRDWKIGQELYQAGLLK